MFHWNRSNFRFWPPVQIWNDLWPIILCNLKIKHRRCIKLYIFGILRTRQTIWHYFQKIRSMFKFLSHVELSRSMAAILEMPQYVAYQKNAVYALIKLSAKSHSFNILRTIDGLSCPTTSRVELNTQYMIREKSGEVAYITSYFRQDKVYVCCYPYNSWII